MYMYVCISKEQNPKYIYMNVRCVHATMSVVSEWHRKLVCTDAVTIYYCNFWLYWNTAYQTFQHTKYQGTIESYRGYLVPAELS